MRVTPLNAPQRKLTSRGALSYPSYLVGDASAPLWKATLTGSSDLATERAEQENPHRPSGVRRHWPEGCVSRATRMRSALSEWELPISTSGSTGMLGKTGQNWLLGSLGQLSSMLYREPPVCVSQTTTRSDPILTSIRCLVPSSRSGSRPCRSRLVISVPSNLTETMPCITPSGLYTTIS